MLRTHLISEAITNKNILESIPVGFYEFISSFGERIFLVESTVYRYVSLNQGEFLIIILKHSPMTKKQTRGEIDSILRLKQTC